MSRLLSGTVPFRRLRGGLRTSPARSFSIVKRSATVGGIIRPFTMNRARPGTNAQFERFWNEPWDFSKCVTDPYSHDTWRNQGAWMRGDGGYPMWWHQAHRLIFQVRRHSTDATLLEFVCEAQAYQIAPGEPFVLYDTEGASGYEGNVGDATTWSFNGFTVPLKQKLTVHNCYAEGTGTGARSVVQIRFPQGVPAGSVTLFNHATARQTGLEGFHWNYNLTLSGTRRWQNAAQMGKAVDLIMAGGRYVHGGLQKRPTWRAWWYDVEAFGQALVHELRRAEWEHVAATFENPPAGAPADWTERWLVEDENEPDFPVAAPTWEVTNKQAASNQMMQYFRDAVFPEMRARLKDVTLCLGPNGFNAPENAQFFRQTFPDSNWMFKVHYYDQMGTAGRWMNTMTEARWAADEAKAAAEACAASGFIATEHSIWRRWWDAPYYSNDPLLRSQALGMNLTAFYEAGGSMLYWGYVGDDATLSIREADNVMRYEPALRARAYLAGHYND